MILAIRRYSSIRSPLRGRRFYHQMYSVETVLSVENLTNTVTKFKAMKAMKLSTLEPKRNAAVLIPLCVVDGKVSILYTLRTSNLRMHRGQVSFPGGMQDEADKNLEDTALRETEEELGITPDRVKLWGTGKPITARSEMNVVPVIGILEGNLDIASLKINPDEVEEAFAAPLEDLCNREKTSYTQFKLGYSTPAFFGAKRRVWGLTGVITHMFLKCLLPPEAYSPNIKLLRPVKSSKVIS